MSAFWDIVADAVEDRLDHDDWCDLVGWHVTKSEMHRLGFRCSCTHGFAIAALRKGPLT